MQKVEYFYLNFQFKYDCGCVYVTLFSVSSLKMLTIAKIISTRSDILQGQALIRGVKKLLTRQKEKMKKRKDQKEKNKKMRKDE